MNSFQPRDTGLDTAALDELTASIRAGGLRLPVELFATEAGYGLLSGYRRLMACRRLEELHGEAYATIPALIRPAGDLLDSFARVVEENDIRQGLTPWERGRTLVAAREMGCETLDAAIAKLYPAANRRKVSRLRVLGEVADAMDGWIDAPEDWSEARLIRLGGVLRSGWDKLLYAALEDAAEGAEWEALRPLIEEAEALVEDHYRTVQPSQQLLDDLRDLILDELEKQRGDAETERDLQRRRIRNLTDERKKLLDAHYADAIPLDLLKIEQDRIASELTAAEERLAAVDIGFETVETNLARAIDFAVDWNGAYLAAGPTLRRQLNQAIFKKLWIDDTHQVTSEFTEPFETLLGEEVTIPAKLRAAEQAGADDDEIDRLWRQLSDEWTASHAHRQLVHAGARNNEPRSGEPLRGLKYETLVGAEGLEPPTSAL